MIRETWNLIHIEIKSASRCSVRIGWTDRQLDFTVPSQVYPRATNVEIMGYCYQNFGMLAQFAKKILCVQWQFIVDITLGAFYFTILHYHILAVISTLHINTSLAIFGGVLITECVFPWSYTKFGSQTRPKQRDELIIEGALMTARLRYAISQWV